MQRPIRLATLAFVFEPSPAEENPIAAVALLRHSQCACIGQIAARCPTTIMAITPQQPKTYLNTRRAHACPKYLVAT